MRHAAGCSPIASCRCAGGTDAVSPNVAGTFATTDAIVIAGDDGRAILIGAANTI